ncbi:MAG: hypothetical protein KAG97_02810, partial [Victivallales bacterium]|nr:hypothetical protein [Victivallales bacterium]
MSNLYHSKDASIGALSPPSRSDVDETLKWNLSAVYASIEEWERDFAAFDALFEKAKAFQDRLGESPEILKCAFEAFDSLHRKFEKVYVYAHLASDEDVSASEPLGRLNRVTARFAEFQGALAWFEPELLALPDERIRGYPDSDFLAFYRRSIDETLRSKPHTLSAPEER